MSFVSFSSCVFNFPGSDKHDGKPLVEFVYYTHRDPTVNVSLPFQWQDNFVLQEVLFCECEDNSLQERTARTHCKNHVCLKN